MHIPDGFIDGPTSAGAALVAAGGLGVSLRRAGQVLDERRVPLAGLTAAFIFAVQMLNFPVAGGTSGHLLGGALAAILVGPSVGAVCVSVVLLVQALLFADGGLSALGLNIVNMALLGAFGGYAAFAVIRRVAPRNHAGVVVASGLAAGASVVLAAVAFAVEYAVGGTGGASVATVVSAMVGVHALVGVGEGIITALVVGSVLATRPDLVFGARDLATDPFALPDGSGGPTPEPAR
jgi:cobalt/nickel transport system permease protein